MFCSVVSEALTGFFLGSSRSLPGTSISTVLPFFWAPFDRPLLIASLCFFAHHCPLCSILHPVTCISPTFCGSSPVPAETCSAVSLRGLPTYLSNRKKKFTKKETKFRHEAAGPQPWFVFVLLGHRPPCSVWPNIVAQAEIQAAARDSVSSVVWVGGAVVGGRWPTRPIHGPGSAFRCAAHTAIVVGGGLESRGVGSADWRPSTDAVPRGGGQ